MSVDETRPCKRCGKPMTTHDRRRRYCSESCAAAALREQTIAANRRAYAKRKA